MLLGEKLVRLRGDKSRNDIEAMLKERGVDVSYNTVKRWELNDGLPRLDEARGLASVFGVSLDYLADDSIENPPTAAGRNANEDRIWKVINKIGSDYAAWVLEAIEDLDWKKAKLLMMGQEGDIGDASNARGR